MPLWHSDHGEPYGSGTSKEKIFFVLIGTHWLYGLADLPEHRICDAYVFLVFSHFSAVPVSVAQKSNADSF